MKVQTFEDLIRWTCALHSRLEQCLAHCSSNNYEPHGRWLLRYLAEYEVLLEDTVEEFKKRADPKALKMWVHDNVDHRPIEPHGLYDAPYADMEFDQICQSVFDLHIQVINLYQYLLLRSDIPEVRDLIEPLLEMEQHETIRLGPQANSRRDFQWSAQWDKVLFKYETNPTCRLYDDASRAATSHRRDGAER